MSWETSGTIFERHVDVALRSLVDANRLIHLVADARSHPISKKKAANARTVVPPDLEKVLWAINQVAPALDGLGPSLSAVGQSVVSIFKVVTKLENNRRELDDRIILVHYLMTLAVFSMRHIAAVELSDQDELEDHFGQLKESMNAFGNFTAFFYSLKRTVRLLRFPELKEKLVELAVQFIIRRSELFDLINAQSETHLNDMQEEFALDRGAVEALIDDLKSVGKKDVQTRKFVDEHGGEEEIILNDDLVNELAKMLGEGANKSLKHFLRDDLDELLSHNEEQFKKKIDGAHIQLTEAVGRTKEAILAQLNEGPHEHIKDEDIKTVWQEMKWRNSVKCRAFVDAIHDHFMKSFNQYFVDHDQEHPNRWTTDILSKVMFHSAISDAIDDDGSGFVSVTETNEFLERKPEGWSVAEWFAFWGQGWASMNDDYREKIQERLHEIKHDIRYMSAGENKDALKGMMKLVSAFIDSIAMSDGNDVDSDIVDNVSDGIPQELQRLKLEFAEKQEARITEGLESTVIDDMTSLVLVLGQPRLELSIMPLLYVWLGNLQSVIALAQEESLEEQDVDQIENVGRTMMAILMLFNSRMVELIRVWRQQRMSVSGQMACFSGGIFNTWYHRSQQTGNIFQRLLWMVYAEENTEEEDGVDEEAEYDDAQTTATDNDMDTEDMPQEARLKGDLDQKVQRVWNRMESVDTRLNTIEGLLRSLMTNLNVSTSASGSVPVQNDDATAPRDVDLDAQQPEPDDLQPEYPDDAYNGGGEDD